MRNIFYFVSVMVVGALVALEFLQISVPMWIPIIVAILIAVGINDIMQTRHAVRRNFPLIGNLRYFFEAIRPEIQQYFVESNTDGRPIDRNDRSVVYQRAKKELEALPFGTQENLYEEGRDWVCHSMFPVEMEEGWERVHVGSEQCKQPYQAARLNISAMSYGSLSKNAVSALNNGAKIGGFYHNTGEGGISPYHQLGGDIVWQLGTGYFGARNQDGGFDPDIFKEKASKMDFIKMIELKLSQGAKPGKGGMLPGAKVTEEISSIRGVPLGKDVISPPGHKEFSDAQGMLQFIKSLRELSGGKPVGFKLCVGHQEELEEVFRQIEKTGILPDFITVDGAEGGTGAAPLEFSNAVGMPLRDGLLKVSKLVDQYGLRKNVRVIASGKSLTAFHMIRNFAMGADMVNSARGMMLALGCIQALRCHSNHCPVGITTNNPSLVAGLDIASKAKRVANYQEETLHVVHSILCAMGKKHPRELSLNDLYQRQGDGTSKTYAEVYGH